MGSKSPAPDAAAPPGMCPFIAVKAGGGSAGGSGGKGAGSGGGGAGAGAGSGADGADGGQAGADAADGACGGAGSGNGCPNPSHGNGSATAGDPVDVATGRVFTLPETDLELAGPLRLIIERFYSSFAIKRDVGLGPGWSHSLAWELEVRRSKVIVWRDDGKSLSVPALKVGEGKRVGDAVVRAHDWGYSVDLGARELLFQNIHARDNNFKLTRVRDRYGNETALSYDDSGQLAEITDCVGRQARVLRGPTGAIAAFEVLNSDSGSWKHFIRYEHDPQGDLVASVDAVGNTTRYSYERHLMTSVVMPSGRTTHYSYDRQRRCVESWVDYGPVTDPAIDDDAPEFLADGTTRACGMLHVRIAYYDDFREVVTSREVRQVFPNEHGKYNLATFAGGVSTAEYDDAGRMTSNTDAIGAKQEWEYDRHARLLEHTDPLGQQSRFEYDMQGFVTAEHDPLGRTYVYQRNHAGDPLSVSDATGELMRWKYDSRGLWVHAQLPDGTATTMSYDAMGNRISVIEPNGASRSFEYDFFGNLTTMIDEHGLKHQFEYDDLGRHVATRAPGGSTTLLEYDADGYLAGKTSPGGGRVELRRGGYDHVHQVRRADGTTLQLRYDREGDVVRVVNEKAEEHRYYRDGGGRIIAETTFDGRDILYQIDLAGRLTRVVYPSGNWIELSYDQANRLVTRSWSDEVVEHFEYDALGRLTKVSDGRVECSYSYDERNNVVRETQSFDGEIHTVDSSYDLRKQRTSKTTSRGYGEQIGFDTLALATTISLAGDTTKVTRGVVGEALERELPGGARIRYRYEHNTRLSRRQLLSATAPAATGEPETLGPAPGVVLDQVYEYGGSGALETISEMTEGSTELAYDAVGRLVRRATPGHAPEEFSHDAAGNLFDGRMRRYGNGGRIEHLDGVDYLHDADGRLVERRRSKDGSDRWRYEWDARGQLAKVLRPDGSHVALIYDSQARRVLKRVVSDEGVQLLDVRYVWDGRALVHELRRYDDPSTGPILEEHTYAYNPSGGLEPFAQRVTRYTANDRQVGPWVHTLNSTVGRPEALINDRGDVLTRYHEKAWGALEPVGQAKASTPLRFAGHWHDEETGLHYNRYRHYDPNLGRYISPEPLGMQGGMSVYGYALGNPVGVADLNGLDPMTATARDRRDPSRSGTSQSAGGRTGRRTTRDDQHPVVRDAMLQENESMIPLGYGRDGTQSPNACAEPTAVSNYLDSQGIPRTPYDQMSQRDQQRTRGALQRMEIGATDSNGNPRAPCRNCSQLLANLNSAYGGPREGNVTPGATRVAGEPGARPFTQPTAGTTRADGSPMHTGYPR